MRYESKWRLCYVDGPWAWFTTQGLDTQWGDGWGKAPYEHNAGDPDEPCWHNKPENLFDTGRLKAEPGKLCECVSCLRDWNADGTPKWALMRMAWEGPFSQPCDFHVNSPWCVRDMNNGKIAWLLADREGESIQAGCSPEEFKRIVTVAGGKVFEEWSHESISPE